MRPGRWWSAVCQWRGYLSACRPIQGLLGCLTLLLPLSGCGGPPPTVSADDSTEALVEKVLIHDRRIRYYYVQLPRAPVPDTGYRLHVVLHGGLGNPRHVAEVTGFHTMGYPVPTIVVFPAGTGRLDSHLLTWNAGYCCGYAQREKVDDVGFLSVLIEELRRVYPIDGEQVAITGHSNGGMMAYRMACERADLVRAIGVVAATMDLSADACRPSRPVSVYHIHGELDRNVPIAGGVGEKSVAGVQHRAVDETLSLWRGFNACDPLPLSWVEDAASIRQYSCTQGSRLRDIRVRNAAHGWWMNGLYETSSVLVEAVYESRG